MQFTEIARQQGKILIPLIGSIDDVLGSVRSHSLAGAEAEHRYHVRGIPLPPPLSQATEAEHELYIGRCSVGLLYSTLDADAVDAALRVKGPATRFVPGSEQAREYVEANRFLFPLLQEALHKELGVEPYGIAGQSFFDGKWQSWNNDSWKSHVAQVSPELAARAKNVYNAAHPYEQIVRFPLTSAKFEQSRTAAIGTNYDRHCSLAWLGAGSRLDGDAQIHVDRNGVFAAFNPRNDGEYDSMIGALYDHLPLPDRVKLEKRELVEAA